MNNEIMTKDQAHELAGRTSTVMRNLRLQNNLYDFLPNPKQASKDDVLMAYSRLYEALDNVFDINQGLESELDDIATALYDLGDQLEGQNNE